MKFFFLFNELIVIKFLFLFFVRSEDEFEAFLILSYLLISSNISFKSLFVNSNLNLSSFFCEEIAGILHFLID